jgi:hypothetical protein
MDGGDGGRAWVRGPRGWLRRLERLGQREVRIHQDPVPRIFPVYALARRLGFPGPTTPAGGGLAFSINGGPGSDLNPNNPTYKSANQTCRALLPAGVQSATGPSPKIAAEVRWARCMRSHGVPSFPDPNNQGAFDSAKFNDTTPAFHTASKACTSLQPTGAVTAMAGQP